MAEGGGEKRLHLLGWLAVFWQQEESPPPPQGAVPTANVPFAGSQPRLAPGHCEGERAGRTRGGRAGTKTQSLPEPEQFRKSWLGRGPESPGGDPRGDRAAPAGPGPAAGRSRSQAAASRRAASQRGSPALRRRGPPPGCPRAGWCRPRSRWGFPAAAAARGSRRPRSFFPHSTFSCLYRFSPPSHPRRRCCRRQSAL